MDPLSLALFGGTALSSIFGAQATNQANNTNWKINLLNRSDRNRERLEARDYAEDIRNEEKLGSTNAQGDRSYWDPVRGWVSELGPRSQALADYFYGTELPEQRAQFGRNAARQREEEDVAGQLRNEFEGITRDDPADVEAMLYEAATRGITENTNDALDSALRNAFRSGTTNLSGITEGINRAGSKQRANAAKDAKLQSLDYVDDKYASRRGQASQLYNLFASRAGGSLGSSYDPSSDIGRGDDLLRQSASLSGQGKQAGFNAIAKSGGSLDYVEPNTALADAFGGLGAAAGGLGDRMAGSAARDQTNSLLKSYITNGGNLNLSLGGIADPISARVRMNGRGMF